VIFTPLLPGLFLRERTLDYEWPVSLHTCDKEGKGISEKPLWKKAYNTKSIGHGFYAFIAPKLEGDTRDQILEALKVAGFREKQPVRKSTESIALNDLEKMLDKVDFITQFGAVRLAHQAMATEGETPELLGILTRGYANLGLLTRHHFNATTYVFTARSWLYAQRLMVANKESDLALWHRAYAWALGGTLQHGLTDLDTLQKKLQNGEEGGEDALPEEALPLWTKLSNPIASLSGLRPKRLESRRKA